MTLTADIWPYPGEVTLAPSAAPTADRALFWSGLGASERTLLDILAETAAPPPPPAIADGETVLSYRALTEEIVTYGRRLTDAGVGVGDRVGVRISSGTAELYIAILAVLSVGAPSVPVDADDPDERADLVFGEADVSAVVGDGGAFTTHGTPRGRPGRPAPSDAAWVIFTSGSTGKPKGAQGTHS